MKDILNSIMCLLFGHKYSLIRNITPTIKEIKCDRCNLEFGMNDDLEVLLPLDKNLKETHKELLK